MTKQRVLLVGFFSCAVLAVSATAGAVSQAAPERSQSLVFNEKFDLPVDNFSRPVDAQEAYTAVNELASYHPDLYFGAFYDDQADTAVLLVATDEGQALARKSLAEANGKIELRSTKHSQEDLTQITEQIFERWPSIAKLNSGWGANPEEEALSLWIDGELTSADRDILEQAATEFGLRIGVLQVSLHLEDADTRATDPSPYAGGLRYATSTSTSASVAPFERCSGAFGVYEGSAEYMLTAGHCLMRGSAVDEAWIFSGTTANPNLQQYMGPMHTSVVRTGVGTVRAGDDDEYHGDIAVIKMASGRAAGTKIFWGTANTTAKIPVIGHKSAADGDPVAYGGAATGSNRGTTVAWRSRNNVPGSGGRIYHNIDFAVSNSSADCPAGGDSGGSVILDTPGAEDDARAMGIISATGYGDVDGTFYPCVMTFTGIEEANRAWGVHLKTE